MEPRNSLPVTAIASFLAFLTAFVQTEVYAQARATEAAGTAPALPGTFVSAAEAFRSKTGGQRLGEGWRLLSLLRKNPGGERSKAMTNFWFGPLIPGLSKANIPRFLGPPDLVYTNKIMGTNTACYVYTCGWDPEGMCVEFSIHFTEAPMVWLNQNSIISAEESAKYQQEVPPRLKPHYDKIVAALTAEDLVPDSSGRLRLPSQFPVVTIAREAYVSRKANELMVAFKCWSGRRNNMEGYLYSDARLADRLIGHQPELRIGPLLVAVEQRIDDHWYLIAYRLD